jgi:hypothetical protein
VEGNLHSEYLIEMFRRQAAAAETADDAPVEASSPRAPIAR